MAVAAPLLVPGVVKALEHEAWFTVLAFGVGFFLVGWYNAGKTTIVFDDSKQEIFLVFKCFSIGCNTHLLKRSSRSKKYAEFRECALSQRRGMNSVMYGINFVYTDEETDYRQSMSGGRDGLQAVHV